MAENQKEAEIPHTSTATTNDTTPDTQNEMPPPPPRESTRTTTTSKRKTSGRPPSNAWIHFTKYKDEDGRQKAQCKYCPKSYYADSGVNGTSSLNSHILKCKNHPDRANTSDLRQSQLSLKPIQVDEGGDESVVVGSLTSWRFDQQFCRIKLVEMIIKDELPFKIVEGEGFREFVVALQAKFTIPSRWTISRDIFKLFENERQCLIDFFKRTGQSVSITTDTWTSLQRINYMCITAHWIDEEWKLTKKIISFCTIESHKGEDMGRQIDGILREWGIKRVISVTVDNASSNDTCLVALRNKLVARGCCVAGGKYLHMRCVAHIVNLVVQDGMKELDISVKRIREAVRFIRHSPARLVRFKECCVEENICTKSLLSLDVPTRWNSTYLMLNAAIKFEKAFELYESKDPFYKVDLPHGVPDILDWENAKKLHKVLQTFFELTNRISGSLYVTSNVFLHEISNMCCLLKEWVRASNMEVREMGVKMKEKFDKYWGDPKKMNKIIFFCVILDPRYKFGVLEFILMAVFGNEIGKEIAKNVKIELYQLYEAYKLLHDPSSSGERGTQAQNVDLSSSSSPYVLIALYNEQKVGEDEVSNDLDVYLSEKADNGKNFDILNWWKVNEPRLPILALLVRDLLSVPISTVASESAFSTGGRVLDAFRSSLTPRIVESLVCTQDWLRKSKQPISIEEDLEGIQKHEEALRSLGIGGEEFIENIDAMEI